MTVAACEQGMVGLLGDEERWAAVLRRDGAADGVFYYSVRTTGVFCRPSCGARRPRRENVAFHATPAEAERSGFRACKRCRPKEATEGQRRAAVVAAACRAIEAAERPPTLDDLAAAAGMSRFHFHRTFTAVTGVTPKAYADARRGGRARSELGRADSVTRAIAASGFGSAGRFYEAAPGLLGMAPVAFRAGGAGAEIRFAVGECSLGSILVAATEKGICAILLGDDPAELVRDLERRFRTARLVGGDESFKQTVARVVGFVDATRPDFDLPLDLRGTAFQRRVWEALREIPAGRTIHYSVLAERIGRPGAARAVARACATNPVAVAIPCHRVVRTDGALSGYRWGLDRKAALLEREREGE